MGDKTKVSPLQEQMESKQAILSTYAQIAEFTDRVSENLEQRRRQAIASQMKYLSVLDDDDFEAG